MKYLDDNVNVLQWASEEIIIPYKSPLDGKWHRYFPDFVIKMRNKDGSILIKMIEIKPRSQSIPPKPNRSGSKPTKKFLREVATYGINMAKWHAAKDYCDDRKWEFVVLTERDLGI
jgi:hypothetical protein